MMRSWRSTSSPTIRPGPTRSPTKHNLHLTEPGSALWRERIAFRDALRADPVLAAEYARLTLALSARAGMDLRAYTDGKRELVARVLAAVDVQLRPA